MICGTMLMKSILFKQGSLCGERDCSEEGREMPGQARFSPRIYLSCILYSCFRFVDVWLFKLNPDILVFGLDWGRPGPCCGSFCSTYTSMSIYIYIFKCQRNKREQSAFLQTLRTVLFFPWRAVLGNHTKSYRSTCMPAFLTAHSYKLELINIKDTAVQNPFISIQACLL